MGEIVMLKHLVKLAVLVGIGYGCFRGYEAWEASRTPLDRAELAMLAGRMPDAIDQLQVALRQDPTNQRIQLMLAEAYDRNGQKTAAAAMYREAQNLLNDPEQSVSMRRHRERFAILRASGY
jgi:Tfp pilus assembly protein PilF